MLSYSGERPALKGADTMMDMPLSALCRGKKGAGLSAPSRSLIPLLLLKEGDAGALLNRWAV